MNENWTETYNRALELANSSYNSWLNLLMWGTERTLEFNKAVVAQIEISQAGSRKYAEDLNNKTREGVQVAQEVWQKSLKSYSTGLSNIRTATESNVDELSRRIEELEQRLAMAAQAN